MNTSMYRRSGILLACSLTMVAASACTERQPSENSSTVTQNITTSDSGGETTTTERTKTVQKDD